LQAGDLIGDADVESTPADVKGAVQPSGRRDPIVRGRYRAMRGDLDTPPEVSTAGISLVRWRNMSTSDSYDASSQNSPILAHGAEHFRRSAFDLCEGVLYTVARAIESMGVALVAAARLGY